MADKQRDPIQAAIDNNEPYDSVKVGLDREELLRLFAAMAREDAENEELTRVHKQLRQEISDEWEEDMNGDDIEVVGEEESVFVEFQGFLKELEAYSALDSYTVFKLLQKIRKYGCHLPRHRSFKYLFDKGSHTYIIKVMNRKDFVSDTIRVIEALKLVKKLVNYAEGLKNRDEGRGLMEAFKHRGLIETLVRLMKQYEKESYEILKRSILILFKFFWQKALGQHHKHLKNYSRQLDTDLGTVDANVRTRILKEGGIVDLLHRIEGFPEYFAAEIINKTRAMREEFPEKEQESVAIGGRGNSRSVNDESPYWDRRMMRASGYYKKRQSEGVPRRQREWDLSSDTGESEEETSDLRRRGGRRKGSGGSGTYHHSSGDFATYNSFDNFQREGIYSDSSSRASSSGASSLANSWNGGAGAYFDEYESGLKKAKQEQIFIKNKTQHIPVPGKSIDGIGGGQPIIGGSAGGPGASPGFWQKYSGAKEYVQDAAERQRLLPHRVLGNSRGSYDHIGINTQEQSEESCCKCVIS